MASVASIASIVAIATTASIASIASTDSAPQRAALSTGTVIEEAVAPDR